MFFDTQTPPEYPNTKSRQIFFVTEVQLSFIFYHFWVVDASAMDMPASVLYPVVKTRKFVDASTTLTGSNATGVFRCITISPGLEPPRQAPMSVSVSILHPQVPNLDQILEVLLYFFNGRDSAKTITSIIVHCFALRYVIILRYVRQYFTHIVLEQTFNPHPSHSNKIEFYSSNILITTTYHESLHKSTQHHDVASKCRESVEILICLTFTDE